jgi:cobyrinic acid a,c-diamide synthase
MDPSAVIPDRHLGLMTAIERGSAELYRRLGQAATETVDLDLVERLADSSGELPAAPIVPRRKTVGHEVRIGIAYDHAFCFYYPDNLDLLEAEGARLIRFSPIHDRELPEVDLLYLGGGYPELYGEALAANGPMRRVIRDFAERGGSIYAECGGMMYLTKAIRDFEGRSHEMVGLFSAEAIMRKPGLTLGYRTVELSRPCILGELGTVVRGHEFHYSALSATGPLDYACRLTDARGEAKGPDGLVMKNTLALYTHLHFASRPLVAEALVESARKPS